MGRAARESLEVWMEGLRLGTLAASEEAAWVFTPEAGRGDVAHALSPLRFPNLEPGGSHQSTFLHGLPGLFSDSIPNGWGARLSGQAVPGGEDVAAVGAWLRHLGHGAVGALRYDGGMPMESAPAGLPLKVLADGATKIAQGALLSDLGAVGELLLRSGRALGGVHPKIDALLPEDSSGIVPVAGALLVGHEAAGHVPVIVKFERHPDECEGAVEYAFSVLAARAGIVVPRAWLLCAGAGRHFACERFDRRRLSSGRFERLHVHTLSGLLEKPAAGCAIDYLEFMQVARHLCGEAAVAEVFRRACFNLVATNRDDHGRNHALLLNRTTGEWRLAPAYDLTPSVVNVLIGLSWNGRNTLPRTVEEVLELGVAGGIARAHAKELWGVVSEAVLSGWPDVARATGVSDAMLRIRHQEMLAHCRGLRLG